jgi:hypothetical protein
MIAVIGYKETKSQGDRYRGDNERMRIPAGLFHRCLANTECPASIVALERCKNARGHSMRTIKSKYYIENGPSVLPYCTY